MAGKKDSGSVSLFAKGLVERTEVAAKSSYIDYKPQLRTDFFWSCCYCTMTEMEGSGLNFHIDHWVPQSFDSSLVNVYSNLYWSCELCNVSKGDIYPPDAARADGYRFLKADEDVYTQHITCKGVRLEGLTKVGEFTVEYAELNRKHLRDLRMLRQAAFECEEFVQQGMRGLLNFPIDELPPEFRVRALKSVHAMNTSVEDLCGSIDEMLMFLSRSPFQDADPEQVKRSAKRAGGFKQLRGLYEGDWRGREIQKRERQEVETETSVGEELADGAANEPPTRVDP